MESTNLTVNTSPHIKASVTTRKIMLDVLIALLPSAIASVILFGLRALLILAVCNAAAFASELVFNLLTKKKQTVGDLSALVTGSLLALSLPASVGIWQCIVGAVFAIVIVKCAFGGIGCNFANPAVTARAFLFIAFSSTLGAFVAPGFPTADIEASATPLSVLKGVEGDLPELIDMLLGYRGGAIGETCAVAILLGFVYLVLRGVIKWELPTIYVGTVFVLSLILDKSLTTALYQVLGGGLLLAAVFMITDYVSTPKTRLGRAVFALGCGLLTVLMRRFGTYPEGVSFAILIMNVLSPYIEKLCRKKPFGGAKNV